MRISKVVCASAVLAGAIAGINAASAATQTANLAVSASVTVNCTVSTAAMAFGAYDVNATSATDATGRVTVAMPRECRVAPRHIDDNRLSQQA